MEPAGDQRDDVMGVYGLAISSRMPQWSPLEISGTTGNWAQAAQAYLVPQWSPLEISGTTASACASASCASPPQWSPLEISGTTWLVMMMDIDQGMAAMEPAGDQRDDQIALWTGAVAAGPQWSPLEISGTTGLPFRARSPRSGRNGARWRSAG